MHMQVHDLVFLLDCGWDEGCSKELLSPLRDVAGHLDAVLLSHPDPQHLGALPVLVRSPAYGPYALSELFLSKIALHILVPGLSYRY